MAQVTGIGGVFFKAKDPEALREWYRVHLGIEIREWGAAAFHTPPEEVLYDAVTVWTIVPMTSEYFKPGDAPFIINYRVRDLDQTLNELRAAGCDVENRVEVSEFGRFGWVLDPENNRLELWQPPAGRFPD